MPDPAAVVTAYARVAALVRARVVAFVQKAWLGLPDYRDADIDRFIALVVPMVTAGQQQIGSLTDAYLANLAAATLGETVRPIGIPTAELTGNRGVEPADVYRRAGVETWTALSNGDDLTTAVGKGMRRATSLAATDIQLAKTRASQYVLDRSPGIVGYRRALTGSRSCGLCVVASTQRYHRAQLLPIHPGCDCAVRPIYGHHDPGHVIDQDSLAAAHQQITERFGTAAASGRGPVDYRDALIVHEHGELGPVLAVRGQDFTGPNDL